MGDRCYMSVTCRRIDMARFEQLGFHLEFEEIENGPIVEMVDEEANYAHCDQLPTDIPFIAENDAGGTYGDGAMVCDGHKTIEIPLAHDGRFVVDWNFRRGLPSLKSILHIRRYLKLSRKVGKLFRQLQEASANQSHPKSMAAESAASPQMEPHTNTSITPNESHHHSPH